MARYKLITGRRIRSATLVADARHSWLDALSSAGALAGLVAVAAGQRWGDPVAGIAVTLFICHVGYEVTTDVIHRLADGVDPEPSSPPPSPRPGTCPASSTPTRGPAGPAVSSVSRSKRGWIPGLTARDADALGLQAAEAVARQVPDMGSFTWSTRAAPS